MTRINKVLKLIYDKKSGMIGFKKGPNFTFKAKNRKDFKMGLRCAMTPLDEPLSTKKGGKKRQML